MASIKSSTLCALAAVSALGNWNSIAADAGSVEERLKKLETQVDGLQKEILPKGEDALAISREGFAQGRFSYLEVLDAQRTLFDIKQEYIRAATTYHQFLVEMERLIGQPIEGGEPQR